MKRLIVITLLVLFILVAAKPLQPEPSIVLSAGSDLFFGGYITFDTVIPKLNGTEYPMVYVSCYQDDVKVYGQLDYHDAIFVLGGGWSPWHESPGDASCQAFLYSYGGKSRGYDVIRELAKTATFDVIDNRVY